MHNIYIINVIITGTDLYLNGEMKHINYLSFDRLNYFTFFVTDYTRNRPNPAGHTGIDWAVSGHIISR